MTIEAPLLDERNADDVVIEVKDALEDQGWQGREGGAGWALVHLFGRLAELVINRLNQVPDKHFRAFLNEAGVDLLAPRPASTELTFTPAEDSPPIIRVPAGTQVATLQTETQPEVVFETQDKIVVVHSELVSCIAFDPRDYADRTEQAKGQGASAFPVFEGQQERQRILYLSDRELFSFTDDASRQAATITLSFKFDTPGDPAADGWELEWLYWDGADWKDLKDAGAIVADGTKNFSLDGDVQLEKLPEMTETEVGGCLFSIGLGFQSDLEEGTLSEDFRQGFENHGISLSDDVTITTEEEDSVWRIDDKDQTYIVRKSEALNICIDGETGLWIACKLTGGNARKHLPVLSSVKGSRSVDIISSQTATADVAFSAIQANTAFVPLDLGNEFFPLGQRPAQLDTFYLMSNEAFSKQGATVTFEIAGLTGVPADVTSNDLDSLEIAWEYYSVQGWTKLGTSTRKSVTPERLGFEDTTLAFTKAGDDQAVSYVRFTVPSDGSGAPIFEETTVNDQKGYWVRARIVDGSYNVPAYVDVKSRLTGDYEFHEAKSYAPLIREWKVTYTGYKSIVNEKDVTLCRSRVDHMVRDHTSALATNTLFAPFSAKEEGPALYLGFNPAFPTGEWIQLLLDVEERAETPGMPPTVIWEYWDGSGWSPLRASDGSQDLRVRGYLGFFSPYDHQAGTEFGRKAFWLRARPHLQPPLADAGSDQAVLVEDGEATLTLDASASRVFNRQHISRYVWRLVSSRPPVADAGADQTVSTPTVTLDASGSQAADERPIVKYIWRRIEPHEESEERRDEKPMATPFLKAIRPNTVSALNAVTISDEVLGSSDGNRDQVFSLTHAPVHADGAQIAVREPDHPPKDELRQLEKELRQTDKEAQALLSPPEAIAAWVRWHQVSDFYDSEPHSRHFVLHPADGQIRFGDGQRGMIPPVGHNNIKAVLYRTHDGAAGNVGAGAITVLRNPGDDLADIRTVTNPEAAAGGSDAETVDEVKQRGPWVLKHRHQAVTHRGFEWLAREASSEVARAYCLSARNPKGLPEPGWVTVVIIPESTAAKPTPNPALVRRVKEYLRDLALTNLTTGVNRIYVKGPEYIEARVRARIVPWNPAKADEVELAVLERLDTFLHPLQGGSKGEGWELGRDVYPSEVYAEIEAVPGVDHVVHVRFLGSMRQQRLYLKKEDYRAPFDLPTDSQVSTFDERIKLLLTKPVFKGQELTSFPVYDFKVDDKVTIVAADNRVLVDDLSIALLSADSITFAAPFDPPADLTQCDALLSSDGRLRLPLAEDGISVDAAGKVVAVTVRGLKAGDQVSVVSYGQRDPRLELLPVEKVEFCEDRIFVPEGHLIYPGSHELEMALE